MRILYLHQNFPGQFLHVAMALRGKTGIEQIAIADIANKRPDIIPTLRYQINTKGLAQPHRLAAAYTVRAIRGEAVALKMLELKRSGFTPDVVIGHFGWGETLFVRDVWPDAKIIVHAEFYYHTSGVDVGFDPEFNQADAVFEHMRVRSKNAAILPALIDADHAITPTKFQRDIFPVELLNKITVLHEGIDTDHIQPDSRAEFRLSSKHCFTAKDEIISFVNRNFEPYRGYHIFMRALPEILQQRPKAHVILVGGNSVSYGAAAPKGTSWQQIFFDEVKGNLPLDRVHFAGLLPHAQLTKLMQISSAHVYLTYPWVLSWSLLESMAAGGLIIGSRTAPVEEVICHGNNGLLVDFFDIKALSATVIDALERQDHYQFLRQNARATIQKHYDLKSKCLPDWLGFISAVTKNNNGVLN